MKTRKLRIEDYSPVMGVGITVGVLDIHYIQGVDITVEVLDIHYTQGVDITVGYWTYTINKEWT